MTQSCSVGGSSDAACRVMSLFVCCWKGKTNSHQTRYRDQRVHGSGSGGYSGSGGGAGYGSAYRGNYTQAGDDYNQFYYTQPQFVDDETDSDDDDDHDDDNDDSDHDDNDNDSDSD